MVTPPRAFPTQIQEESAVRTTSKYSVHRKGGCKIHEGFIDPNPSHSVGINFFFPFQRVFEANPALGQILLLSSYPSVPGVTIHGHTGRRKRETHSKQANRYT